MSGRLRAIAVVVALAAIAFVVYRNQHQSNVVNIGGTPSVVLVATRLIERGTAGSVVGSTGLYRKAHIARSQVEAGAFVEPSMLAGKVALTNIEPGAQLTAADFAAATTSPPTPGPSQRAVVVPLRPPASHRGRVTVGDHVDVWVAATKRGSLLRKLYKNLFVLGASANDVTLRASPQQAARLIDAMTQADRLALRFHR